MRALSVHSLPRLVESQLSLGICPPSVTTKRLALSHRDNSASWRGNLGRAGLVEMFAIKVINPDLGLTISCWCLGAPERFNKDDTAQLTSHRINFLSLPSNFVSPATFVLFNMSFNSYSPSEAIELVSRAGVKKGNMRPEKVFLSAFSAGCLLSFAAASCLVANTSPWVRRPSAFSLLRP